MAESRTVFLDIGGVVLTNGWDTPAREKAAKHFDLDFAVMNHLHSFIFNVYEIGKITLDQYLDTIVFTQPRKFTHKEFKQFMMEQSEELPGMIPWLSAWKKKTYNRVISINNEGREMNDYRIEKFGLKNCFDAFVSSCEVGMRKPDPGIFQLALGLAHTKAEDCIYFDDRAMLVDAAKTLRIPAYQHESFEKTKAILEKL
ncbi:MAG: HAD-IA family hydrolase [Bacteroidota bacterium]